MASIRIYLDEDVHAFIAHALRLRDWEALTTIEADRQGATDIDQIRFATENGYAIVSYNVSDFPRLHAEIIGGGDHHAGIIVATQEDPRANTRALLSLVSSFSADDFVDQLIYLNNWM
jgi:hypothetical protein